MRSASSAAKTSSVTSWPRDARSSSFVAPGLPLSAISGPSSICDAAALLAPAAGCSGAAAAVASGRAPAAVCRGRSPPLRSPAPIHHHVPGVLATHHGKPTVDCIQTQSNEPCAAKSQAKRLGRGTPSAEKALPRHPAPRRPRGQAMRPESEGPKLKLKSLPASASANASVAAARWKRALFRRARERPPHWEVRLPAAA